MVDQDEPRRSSIDLFGEQIDAHDNMVLETIDETQD